MKERWHSDEFASAYGHQYMFCDCITNNPKKCCLIFKIFIFFYTKYRSIRYKIDWEIIWIILNLISITSSIIHHPKRRQKTYYFVCSENTVLCWHLEVFVMLAKNIMLESLLANNKLNQTFVIKTSCDHSFTK